MGRNNNRVILLICSAAFILILLSTGQYGATSQGVGYVREGYYAFDKVITAPFKFVADVWNSYIGLVNTSRENKELRQKNDRLKVRSMIMDEIKSENRRLRVMLDFKEAHRELSLIPADLLSQDITLIFKTAIIDKGTSSGFHADMAILSPNGVVGKVVAVSPHTSQILLITDPNSAIPAVIESTRVKGIIKGRGGNLLTLEYVRRAEDVKKGDSIVTSGLLGIFPPGLKIGSVVEVRRDVNRMFADIIVKPYVEMDKIEGIFGIAQDMEASD
jgi:rod shape-determining protein MreC